MRTYLMNGPHRESHLKQSDKNCPECEKCQVVLFYRLYERYLGFVLIFIHLTGGAARSPEREKVAFQEFSPILSPSEPRRGPKNENRYMKRQNCNIFREISQYLSKILILGPLLSDFEQNLAKFSKAAVFGSK